MARIDPLPLATTTGHRQRSDSGSSHESSSRHSARQQIRSFSPTSDDGNLVVQVPDDDTPPPPNQPIIRQSLGAFSAFSPGSSTSTLSSGFQFPVPVTQTPPGPTTNAYASVPLGRRQPEPRFLPGQKPEVIIPASASEKKRKSRTRKTNSEFSAQTTRFRITQNPPPAAPKPSKMKHPEFPPSSDPAPSKSQFRAVQYSHETHYPPRTPATYHSQSTTDNANREGQNMALPAPPILLRSLGYHSDVAAQNASHSGSSVDSPSSSGQGFSLPGQVYQQDYSQTEGSSGVRSRMVTLLIKDVRGCLDTTDEPENGLQEIHIPLREMEHDTEDGYWAKASDVCEQLQAGAGKIDGPARVYCMRNIYKQVILRIEGDGSTISSNENVHVQSSRTLEVVIEELSKPKLQRQRRQPSSPLRRRRSPSPGSGSSLPYGRRERDFHGMPNHHNDQDHYEPRNGRHKRRYRRSTDSDEYRHSSPSISSRRGESSSTNTFSHYGSSASTNHRSHYRDPGPSLKRSRREVEESPSPPLQSVSILRRTYKSPLSPPQTLRQVISPRPGISKQYDSPNDSDDDSVIHEKLTKSADIILCSEPNYPDFFKASARPGTANDVLEQYKVVYPWLLKHSGVTKPFRSRNHVIKDVHLCEGLWIEGDAKKWAAECREATSLLALYGPEGTRLQDPRVIAALEDQKVPLAGEKPMKRLRKLLREIDAAWVQDHPHSVF